MNSNRIPLIVAELGTSHLGSIDRALELIDTAGAAGADAVKFQTYTPEEISVNVPIENGPWAGQSYHDLYARGMTPWKWHERLFEHARDLGLIPFSTPFSVEAVARLESLDCPMYKIASPEITHLQLVAAVARTGKPLIISTGMASLQEIFEAEEIAKRNGAKSITFLHCISAYPAKPEMFNLNTMHFLHAHGRQVGLSDHSLGSVTAITAVALGASVVEKHFTLDRNDGGLDAAFSLEPHEFAAMANSCREAAAALGTSIFGARSPEEATSLQYRRSVWVVKPLKAGEQITDEHVAVLRPAYGLHPRLLGDIIGKRVNQEVGANTPMRMDLLE